MNTLIQDLRYALRTLLLQPGFTAAAVLSLSIGIGANTAIFSVANGLLLRPLPYQEADRLAILWNRSPGLNIAEDWFSTAQYFDIRNGHSGFEQLAIAIGGNYNLTGDGEPERIGVVRMSSNLLPMLGVQAAAGRLFLPEEDAAGRPGTALLSHGTWVRRYGADKGVLGRSIILNGQPFQVAGILPASFSLPREVMPTLNAAENAEIVLPLPLTPSASTVRTHEDYNIVGRLKPGVTVSQAQAEMDTITARLRREYPELYPPNGGLTFSIVPLLEQVVGDVRRTLFMLLGSAACVLLIVCANVANLLLSRAARRQKEIAVRMAVGANRGRIVRQLLTESLLLALLGGTLGVPLSIWSLDWIRVLGTKSVPRLEAIEIDARVLLFTLGVTAIAGVLFGLAPALRFSRLDLHSTLKDASRGSGASSMWGRGNNVRRTLVIAELALSVVLLIGAGLLIRSFAGLQNVPPGFNPKGVLTFGLTLSGRKYDTPRVVMESYRLLWDRLERLPGVSAAGGITALPLSLAFAWTPVVIEGRVPPAGETFLNADARTVAGHYFEAMEIPLRRGRFFNLQDAPDKPRAVIVDEHFAQQFWPGQDPVGKRIRMTELKAPDPWMTIVGVVGRVKQDSLDSDPRIAFYLPQGQSTGRAMTVAVRCASDPAGMTAAMKKETRALDPDLPIYALRTMEARVAESLARRRFAVLLLGLFAGVALVLATIGIYGVLAYLVSQGAREMGIRIALGAPEGAIIGLVVRQGMMLTLTGVGIGLAGAFVSTRFMRSMLFGVEATDGLTFLSIPVLLTLVALAASYIPARRASRVDPMVSLRCD